MHAKMLWAVYVPSLLLAIAGQIGFILLPLYVLDLGAGPAIASFVTAGIGVGMVLFDIPAGFLASRFGDKWLMLAGVVIAAITSIAISQTTAPSLLFLLAMARGASSAAWLLGLLSFLTHSLQPHERGRTIAMMGGTLRFGALIGPYGGGLIATAYGYSYAFLFAGVLAIGAILIIVRQHYASTQVEPSDQHFVARFKAVISSNRRTFATAGYASIGLQLMRAARQLLIPLVGHLAGLDAADIGLIFSVSAAIDMAMFYPAGMAMDRFGRKSVGVPCMTLFALGLGLIPWANSFVSLLLVAGLLGFANGLGSGIILTIGSDLAPKQRRSEFLGVWRFIGDVGNASAPILIGALLSTATLAAAALTIAGVGLSSALVLALLVAETLQRKPD